MEDTKSKRCYGCFSYQCYYTKGYMRFTREQNGYCTHHQKSVGNKEACENWRSNQSRRFRMDNILGKSLTDTIGELIQITNIIKDYIENRKLSELARERLTKKLNTIEAEINKEE